MRRQRSTNPTVTAVLAVAVAALSACGGGGSDLTPVMAGYKVSNADQALVQADIAFHKEAEDSGANSAKNSRCYYRMLTADNVDEHLWCGPVRHLGSREDALWDTFDVDANPDNAKSLSVTGVTSTATGQSLPPAAKLRRPDGKTPPSKADKLAAPPPPAADPGFTELVEDDVSGASMKALPDAQLIGPGLSVKVSSAGAVDAVGAGKDMKSAAGGEQLWAAKLSFGPGPSSPDPNLGGMFTDKIKVEPKLVLITGQDRRSLDTTKYASDYQDPSGETTLVVSVPKANGAPQLGLDVAGQEQTISLADGTRGGYKAAAFYRKNPVANVARQYANATRTDGDYTGHVSFFVDKVFLTAFDEAHLGWASAGKAWLEVPMTSFNAETSSYPYTRNWSDESWKAVGADGTSYPYMNKGGAGGTAVFQVPEDVTTLTVTIAPVQTFTLASSASPDYTKPSSGTAHFPALTIAVTFASD